MRVALGGGHGGFDIADHPFEDIAAAMDAMFDRDLGRRCFDRIAFGQRRFIFRARTVEFAARAACSAGVSSCGKVGSADGIGTDGAVAGDVNGGIG